FIYIIVGIVLGSPGYSIHRCHIWITRFRQIVIEVIFRKNIISVIYIKLVVIPDGWFGAAELNWHWEYVDRWTSLKIVKRFADNNTIISACFGDGLAGA